MWRPLPIGKWFANASEAVLSRSSAAIENAFINEAGGLTGFWGLRRFVTLPSGGRVYLDDWKDSDGDLIAVTGQGRVFRVDKQANATDVTNVPLSGGRRPTFAKTDDQMLIAAGGPILAYAGKETQPLSSEAPDSTHVGYLDGFTIAIEPRSGRFFHTQAGVSTSWDPLDVFTADGKPDDLNALVVTPFRELLLCGVDSIEQFERLPSGDRPFARRWATGEGVYAPYTLITDIDAGTWGINRKREFVRMSGQTSRPVSDDIGRAIAVDADGAPLDYTDAWGAPILAFGQKFLLLQLPEARTPYGTKGLTLLFDYRVGRWYALYGWDNDLGLPARWPGWSVHSCWGRTFVGGEGIIFELIRTAHDNDGSPRRTLLRSAHYPALEFGGKVARIDNIRARLKRGAAAQNSVTPVCGIRLLKDGRKPTKWARRSLGRSGETGFFVEFGSFGECESFQVEFVATDAAELELVSLEADITPLAR
jgi:hypothetical protein